MNNSIKFYKDVINDIQLEATVDSHQLSTAISFLKRYASPSETNFHKVASMLAKDMPGIEWGIVNRAINRVYPTGQLNAGIKNKMLDKLDDLPPSTTMVAILAKWGTMLGAGAAAGSAVLGKGKEIFGNDKNKNTKNTTSDSDINDFRKLSNILQQQYPTDPLAKKFIDAVNKKYGN